MWERAFTCLLLWAFIFFLGLHHLIIKYLLHRSRMCCEKHFFVSVKTKRNLTAKGWRFLSKFKKFIKHLFTINFWLCLRKRIKIFNKLYIFYRNTYGKVFISFSARGNQLRMTFLNHFHLSYLNGNLQFIFFSFYSFKCVLKWRHFSHFKWLWSCIITILNNVFFLFTWELFLIFFILIFFYCKLHAWVTWVCMCTFSSS